jgi:arylsulfatase
MALAGAEWPKNPKAPPVPGRNIAPLFEKDGSLERDCLWWLHQGNKAIRVGDWKLVARTEKGAKGEAGAWELYDLKTDRSETVNLAAKEPAKAKELAALWEAKWEQFKKDAASEPLPKKK